MSMNSFKALFYQRLRGYVFVVTQVTCIAHLFTQHVANVGMCEGASMLPTLNPHGDILLQESLSLKTSPPRLSRGDLVISISPVDPTRLVCKRLLGLPGDTQFEGFEGVRARADGVSQGESFGQGVAFGRCKMAEESMDVPG
ncbi:unnamed protein product [Rhizoctonia solani]|uniref:Peptidase S26 domain-containing protein n=1 Tax=Rhizoctonia solani TaxID=456999 RepID=A0A8H3H9I7_9AGAM|nr:unnamed protein product [Rhizoctonia solani]